MNSLEIKSHTHPNRLYIVLISIHGLIRGENLELGRDADTGGQIRYLIELARVLTAHPAVDCVDILTRRIIDHNINNDYAKPIEFLSPHARIIRLECGPKRYLRKEVLWPHLDGFIDKSLQHIRSVGRIPDIIHGHYADAGLVSAQLAGLLGVPFIFTGHSLGRDKLFQLLKKGVKKETIESHYNISQRIEAEEIALESASMVIASTHQEINQQYAHYDHYQPSRMTVIPPGVDLSQFHPATRDENYDHVQSILYPFLENPEKPMIVAVSRADERKNIATLVKAYGESSELQQLANLVVIAGNRHYIPDMDRGSRDVLIQLLMLIDKYNLYGKVAYPKHHLPDDIPALYRLGAKTHGVFINPALTEPFGLTLIEAAASGLPIVATNDGGPKEIISLCKNGVMINPHDIEDISTALLTVLKNRKRWQRESINGSNGALRHYSWKGHAETYINEIQKRITRHYRKHIIAPGKSRLPMIDRLAISAIDNSLCGDKHSLIALMRKLKQSTNKNIGYGIATGRSLQGTLAFIKKENIAVPDVIISSVGTKIHYSHTGKRLVEDSSWRRHINYRWQADKIRSILQSVEGIKLALRKEQQEHKISYQLTKHEKFLVRDIKRKLRVNDVLAKIILTEDKFLDVLPVRASKGLAIRYIAIKWGLPLEHIFVAGDSGNDEEMLLGDTLAVVVSNHGNELAHLKNETRIFFTKSAYAQGIIEGLDYYNFLDEIRIKDNNELLSMSEAS